MVSAADGIATRIESLPEFTRAGCVLAFVPMAHRPEVDLRPLIGRALAAGKVVALPRTDWPARTMTARVVVSLEEDLEPDAGMPAAGLLHPREACPVVEPGRIDLLLVPGLGFDLAGTRIGHGAGFYDRFLARIDGPAPVVGVGFDVQVLPEGQSLPREPHDRPLDALVTESRMIRFQGPASGGRRGPG